MEPRQFSEQRLEQIYQLLREALSPPETPAPGEPGWYSQPLPPIDPGSRLSATDLLSWWFRPPTASRDPWSSYFGEQSAGPVTRELPREETRAAKATTDPISRAAIRALLPASEEELSREDADGAMESFYEFLHAFGRHDVEAAVQYVAEDYHTFEDECEVNRDQLRNRLEALLASLDGYALEVSLSMVPEPISHPYGIIMYVEIQVDAIHAETGVKRNIVDRRLALLQRQVDGKWKIAALGKVRV